MGTGGMRIGAGRPAWRQKAEACLRIDVREFARRRLFGAGLFSWKWTNTYTGERAGSASVRIDTDRMELFYSVNDSPVSQSVRVDREPCYFGGVRLWFRCGSCHRRAAILYFAGGAFNCRLCARVAYTCQSEDSVGRAWRKQAKLEARLDPDWQRPKGMRLRTFDRIISAITDCEMRRECALADFLVRRGLLDAL